MKTLSKPSFLFLGAAIAVSLVASSALACGPNSAPPLPMGVVGVVHHGHAVAHHGHLVAYHSSHRQWRKGKRWRRGHRHHRTTVVVHHHGHNPHLQAMRHHARVQAKIARTQRKIARKQRRMARAHRAAMLGGRVTVHHHSTHVHNTPPRRDRPDRRYRQRVRLGDQVSTYRGDRRGRVAQHHPPAAGYVTDM